MMVVFVHESSFLHCLPFICKQSNGSVERSNLANANAPSSERSTTPILQDFVDPSMYYLSSGYASQPYYFGSMSILFFQISFAIMFMGLFVCFYVRNK